jgi:hypothetical protein
MGLRSKDDERAPRTTPLAHPTVSEESFLLLQDNPGFVRTATGLAIADRLGTTGIDGKVEAEDSLGHASFVENIPVFLNHRFKFDTSSEIDMITNTKVLFEFRSVTDTVPVVNVCARGFESSWKLTHRFATLCED